MYDPRWIKSTSGGKAGRYADGIIFPSGHVEENEPVVDSVIREMKEETGLTIETPILCGVKEWFNEDGSRYIVFMFRIEKYTGKLRSSEEGRVFWMEIDDVLKSHWIWNMDDLLRIMVNNEYTELYLDRVHNWKATLK